MASDLRFYAVPRLPHARRQVRVYVRVRVRAHAREAWGGGGVREGFFRRPVTDAAPQRPSLVVKPQVESNSAAMSDTPSEAASRIPNQGGARTSLWLPLDDDPGLAGRAIALRCTFGFPDRIERFTRLLQLRPACPSATTSLSGWPSSTGSTCRSTSTEGVIQGSSRCLRDWTQKSERPPCAWRLAGGSFEGSTGRNELPLNVRPRNEVVHMSVTDAASVIALIHQRACRAPLGKGVR